MELVQNELLQKLHELSFPEFPDSLKSNVQKMHNAFGPSFDVTEEVAVPC